MIGDAPQTDNSDGTLQSSDRAGVERWSAIGTDYGEDIVVASVTKLVTSFCPVDVLLSQ